MGEPKAKPRPPKKKAAVEEVRALPDRVSGEVSNLPTMTAPPTVKPLTPAELARLRDVPWLVPLPDDAPPGAKSVETLLPPELWDYLKARFRM